MKETAVHGETDTKETPGAMQSLLEWRDANQSAFIARYKELCGISDEDFAIHMATRQRRRRVGAYTV